MADDMYIALEEEREFNMAEDVYVDPEDLFLQSNIWNKRRHTGKALIKAAEAKDITKYVRIAGGLDEALLSIIMEKDYKKFPEGKIILFVIELLKRGAKINCTDAKGDMPLHLAALRGFTELARELHKWGAEPNALNGSDHTAMEIAIHLALDGIEETVEIYNTFATFIIREMEPSRVRDVFIAEPNKPAKLCFHSLLNNADMKETVQAVLDCLIERVPGHKRTYTVHYSVLEANENGRVFSKKSRLSLQGKTAFDEIAWRNNKEAVTHLSVLLLIQSKWRRFAKTSLILHFLFWLVLMVALTCSLIFAAAKENPRIYDKPIDKFRGVCECVTFVMLAGATLSEIYHLYLWRLQYFKDYNFFVYNYLNVTTMLFVIVLIPLRVVNNDKQWIFGSLAYVSYSVRVFRYLHTVPILGKYVQILYHILLRDMFPFLSMFFVVLFIFSGAFYFALREEVLEPASALSSCDLSSLADVFNSKGLPFEDVLEELNNRTSTFRTSLDVNPAETSSYPRIFLTGIRLMVEDESFLTYFGANGYRWLGVLTYMLFIFTIQVVLLNLLIAQMSNTFSSVQEDAQRALIINKARTIISIERTGLSILKCLTDFFVREETWKNPREQVQKINMKSLDSIDVNTRLVRGAVNKQSLLMEELRDALAEQKMSFNTKLDEVMEHLKKGASGF